MWERLRSLIADGSGNIDIPIFKWGITSLQLGVSELSAGWLVVGVFVILCRYSRCLEMLCPAGR